MPLNDKPCNTCRSYDPIRNGLTKDGDVKYGDRGWCAVKSLYPFKEMEGQVFPPGVKRNPANALPPANPFIVVGAEVQEGCGQYTAK